MLQRRSTERARPSIFRAVEEECANSFLDHYPYCSRNTRSGCSTDNPKASGRQTAPILNHRRDATSHKARDSAGNYNDKPHRRRYWLWLCLWMATMGKVVPHRPSRQRRKASAGNANWATNYSWPQRGYMRPCPCAEAAPTIASTGRFEKSVRSQQIRQILGTSTTSRRRRHSCKLKHVVLSCARTIRQSLMLVAITSPFDSLTRAAISQRGKSPDFHN